ncbi:MAG: hypothetical protein H7263_07850, partial [Candidatus Sericytochromatia bacterium]|nr:hypothetical protein [Candidatus Sericytochromatia bacterium]
VSSFDFKLLAAQWPKTPINVSGSLGTSDQANLALDEVGSIHTVWRQDGFDTNSDSGVIYYSRWNGISWTSQGFNISQYNNSGLKGSRDPSVAVGLDRLPQIVWSAKNDTGVRQIYFAQFDGTTWKSPTSILGSDSGVTPSISVDKTNGFLYTTWENNGKIYLSEYNKVTWSSPTVVGSGTTPKAKIGTDSIVHIVWKTSSQSLQYANWRSGKGLSSVENIPMNSLGNDTGSSIDTAIDRFNRLHLVWRNDIYIQYSLRSNVSWSQPEIVNQLPTAFLSAKSGASISVAPTGIVNIAWVSTTKDNKEVIRFRRKLSDGFKQPFTKILDSTEPVKVNNGTVTATPTTTAATEIKRSENIDGYEDIPFSNTASIAGNPLILADYKGNIHVIWSNKGANGSDADLLHSIKGNVEVIK